MLLRELAMAGKENYTYDCEWDNEWHGLTRDEIIENDEYGTHRVLRWFVSTSDQNEIVVECTGSFEDYDFVSATQAAEIIGVSRMRVNQLINAHVFPARMIGGMWAIERNDVERYLEEHGKKRKPFERYELDVFLGDFANDFDIDAIIDEATEIDGRGNRVWRDNIDLNEICARHDRTA